MRVANETSVWRDIVNQTSEWRDSYNANSVTDYVDTVVSYYRELIGQYDIDNPEAWPHILVELTDLMDAQIEQWGEMGNMRVMGNGIYLPSASDEFKFFDGSQGVAGEYAGFSISTLPVYQDLLYSRAKRYRVQPVLCIELSDYREYSNTGIQLEPNGDAISIPVEAQDLCFSRAS